MMEQLEREELHFELHYAMRSKTGGAYWTTLRETYGRRVHTYFDELQQNIPLTRLLENQPLGTHLYVCGPSGMIDWVLTAAREGRMGRGEPALRALLCPPAGAPFIVELAKAGCTIDVKPTRAFWRPSRRRGSLRRTCAAGRVRAMRNARRFLLWHRRTQRPFSIRVREVVGQKNHDLRVAAESCRQPHRS